MNTTLNRLRALPYGVRVAIPCSITLLGVCLGILSIHLSLHGSLQLAAWVALGSVLTDVADGGVARRLNGQSKLGALLDDLSDTVAHGCCPPILLVSASMPTTPTSPHQWLQQMGDVPSATYVVALLYFCMVYARNHGGVVASTKTDKEIRYYGLVTTYGLALFMAFYLTWPTAPIQLHMVTLLLATVCMYPWHFLTLPHDRILEGGPWKVALFLFATYCTITKTLPEVYLFWVFSYMLYHDTLWVDSS